MIALPFIARLKKHFGYQLLNVFGGQPIAGNCIYFDMLLRSSTPQLRRSARPYLVSTQKEI